MSPQEGEEHASSESAPIAEDHQPDGVGHEVTEEQMEGVTEMEATQNELPPQAEDVGQGEQATMEIEPSSVPVAEERQAEDGMEEQHPATEASSTEPGIEPSTSAEDSTGGAAEIKADEVVPEITIDAAQEVPPLPALIEGDNAVPEVPVPSTESNDQAALQAKQEAERAAADEKERIRAAKVSTVFIDC